MQSNEFYVGAYWQSRGETPRDLALRVKRYVALARTALPPDLEWFSCGRKLLTLCESDDGLLASEKSIADCVAKDQDLDDPAFGYNFNFHLAKEDPAPSFEGCSMIHLKAGADLFRNCCVFTSQGATIDETDPRLVTYDVMRAHMMAIVWAFQPSWCTAAPSRLHAYLDDEVYVRPPIGLGG